MKLISLTEFKKLAFISDSTLLWLLEQGTLPCVVGENGRIQIPIENVDAEHILSAIISMRSEVLSDEYNLIREKLARILSENIDLIVHDAINYNLRNQTTKE